MNWLNTTWCCCSLRSIGFNFIHSQDVSLRRPKTPREWRTSVYIHVLTWRFAKISNFAETATFLRQIASDVMSHAQIPAMQLFWGMHGLVLETSIWLLAESTRSQLRQNFWPILVVGFFGVALVKEVTGPKKTTTDHRLDQKDLIRQSISFFWLVYLCVFFVIFLVFQKESQKNEFVLGSN